MDNRNKNIGQATASIRTTTAQSSSQQASVPTPPSTSVTTPTKSAISPVATTGSINSTPEGRVPTPPGAGSAADLPPLDEPGDSKKKTSRSRLGLIALIALGLVAVVAAIGIAFSNGVELPSSFSFLSQEAKDNPEEVAEITPDCDKIDLVASARALGVDNVEFVVDSLDITEGRSYTIQSCSFELTKADNAVTHMEVKITQDQITNRLKAAVDREVANGATEIEGFAELAAYNTMEVGSSSQMTNLVVFDGVNLLRVTYSAPEEAVIPVDNIREFVGQLL